MDKKVLMAPNLDRMEGYLQIRKLDPEEYQLITRERELMKLPLGAEVTLICNHCDWKEEAVLKRRALSMNMQVTEVYG